MLRVLISKINPLDINLRQKIEISYNEIKESNKPLLSFIYNNKETWVGRFRYIDNKTQIIELNMSFLNTHEESLLTLAHELGHWEHYSKDKIDFFKHKHDIICKEKREAFNSYCEIEEIADQNGSYYAEIFNVKKEYLRELYFDKKFRESWMSRRRFELTFDNTFD